MKANEAPEKIYIFEQDFQRKDHKVMYGVNQDKDIKGLIEYTSTDVFIKQLKAWLMDNSANYMMYDPLTSSACLEVEKMIDDFEEYLKK